MKSEKLVISFNGVDVDFNNLKEYVPIAHQHYFCRTMVARFIAKHIGTELNPQTRHLAASMIKRARKNGEIELIRPRTAYYRFTKKGG